MMGIMIGGGIFATPAAIADHLASPALILLLWVVGGLLALFGGLTYAELASMHPESGGIYVFLREGYGLVYEPRAAVRHSHAYTIATAFRRFFDSGVSAQHSYVEGDESRAALRRAGGRYAREELAWLWRTGRRRWIPYTVTYELGKFAGLQLGLRHERLPRSVVRRLGSYDIG